MRSHIGELTTVVNVAQALSGKRHVRVTVSGSSAYTALDEKPIRVNVPILDLNKNPDEMLVLIRGYIDHEVGHVRYTKREDMPETGGDILRALHNICEDIYVERRMGEAFEGSKKNLSDLSLSMFSELDEQSYASDLTTGSPDRIINAILNYVLRSARSKVLQKLEPVAHEMRIMVNSVYPGLADALDKPIGKVMSTTSTKDCVELANEMYETLKNFVDTNRQSGGDQQSGMTDEAIAALEDAVELGWADPKHYDTGGIVGDKLSKEGGKSGRRYDMSRLVKRTKAIPESVLKDAARTSGKLRAKLSGLLQAEVLQYGKVGRVGMRVSTRRLASAMVSPRAEVFMRKRVQRGVDTHIIMLLDASGSMYGEPMNIASSAVYATVQACQQPGLVTSAYAFNSETFAELVAPHTKPDKDRMYVAPSGGTPLFEAAIDTMLRFDRKCNRKVLILLTDGHGDSEMALPVFRDAARVENVEVVGIGIQDPYLESILPFGSASTINELAEFPSALSSLLLRLLIERG